jgi:hypothetical protein
MFDQILKRLHPYAAKIWVFHKFPQSSTFQKLFATYQTLLANLDLSGLSFTQICKQQIFRASDQRQAEQINRRKKFDIFKTWWTM